MHKLSFLIVLIAVISIHPETASAQKSTEFYIPVDASPGLSSQYTWKGTIDAVDAQNMTLTVTNETGTRNIKLTQDSQVWLDKSRVNASNEIGDVDDCRPGLYVEIKYKENEASNEADWVKIKIDA